jgi:hypothetical protein
MATATLTWIANTESDLAGYDIYRAVGTGPLTLLTSVGKVSTYVDTTVPNISQNVSYALKAFDFAGNRSPLSATVTKAVDVNPPQAPAGLDVVIG